MSDFIPKGGDAKVRGLGPKAQKLQALRDKAAAQSKGGDKAHADSSASSAKTNTGFKKTSFQRKAT